MLHQVIRRAYYLKKHLEAPMLQEREEYLEDLASQGYCRESVKITAEYLLRIIQFLHLEEDRIITIEAIESAAAAWARSPHHHPQKKKFSKSGGKEVCSSRHRLAEKDQPVSSTSGRANSIVQPVVQAEARPQTPHFLPFIAGTSSVFAALG